MRKHTCGLSLGLLEHKLNVLSAAYQSDSMLQVIGFVSDGTEQAVFLEAASVFALVDAASFAVMCCH